MWRAGVDIFNPLSESVPVKYTKGSLYSAVRFAAIETVENVGLTATENVARPDWKTEKVDPTNETDGSLPKDWPSDGYICKDEVESEVMTWP